MLRNVLFLVCLLFPTTSFALTTSERALRLEDSKEGNVVLGAEQATLERGEIYKTVLLLWGRLDVYGEVDEVVVLSGHVAFHDGARLHKSLVVMGGTFESQPGAAVNAEKVVAKVPGPVWRILRSAGTLWRDNIDWVARLLGGLVSCLFLWLSAWALFHAFPGLQKSTEGALAEHWPKNLVLGLLGSILACALFVTLVISILGILLIPLYLLLLGLAAWISYSAAALWAGHRMLPPKPGKRIHPLGLLLGCLALQFLWIVPVWWSALPVWLLWTLAWGALVRSLRQLWR